MGRLACWSVYRDLLPNNYKRGIFYIKLQTLGDVSMLHVLIANMRVWWFPLKAFDAVSSIQAILG